jgi:hypothetical protein
MVKEGKGNRKGKGRERKGKEGKGKVFSFLFLHPAPSYIFFLPLLTPIQRLSALFYEMLMPFLANCCKSSNFMQNFSLHPTSTKLQLFCRVTVLLPLEIGTNRGDCKITDTPAALLESTSGVYVHKSVLSFPSD